MLPQVRRQKILDLIKDRDITMLSDLIGLLGLSESTVRRDLKLLSQQGELELLRGGGIRLISANYEKDVITKMLLQQEEKKRIAALAAGFVEPGDVLFLDPSTANSMLINHLADKDVSVVTNSLMHINQMLKLGIRCYMIGGQIKTQTLACVGVSALSAMDEYRFSKSFLGANGMDAEMGITNHDPNELHIKRLAIKYAVKTFFLIDSSKYGTVNMCKVADLDEHPVITDRRLQALEPFNNILYAE